MPTGFDADGQSAETPTNPLAGALGIAMPQSPFKPRFSVMLAVVALLLAASPQLLASTTPTASLQVHAPELGTDVIHAFIKPDGSIADVPGLSRQFSEFWNKNEAALNQQPAKIVVIEFTNADIDEIQRGQRGISATYINVRGDDGRWSRPDKEMLGRVIEWQMKAFGAPAGFSVNIFALGGMVLLVGGVLLAARWWWKRRKKLKAAVVQAPPPEPTSETQLESPAAPGDLPPVVRPARRGRRNVAPAADPPEVETLRAVEWQGPVAMETGAPEPSLFPVEHDLWIAYLAIDPHRPGWEDPGVFEYSEAHPGEPWGVIWFEGVESHTFGHPNDERLHEHPLYGHGIELYSFHRVEGAARPTWIVTFHDETLEVVAARAFAHPERVFAEDQAAAIALVRAAQAPTESEGGAQ